MTCAAEVTADKAVRFTGVLQPQHIPPPITKSYIPIGHQTAARLISSSRDLEHCPAPPQYFFQKLALSLSVFSLSHAPFQTPEPSYETASADVFSVAANSFSVVGLADVVFRCGKQVYEAVAKMQQVSADVKQLLTEVKDLEETVVRINMFSNDLDQAKLPQRDKRIVGNINGLLARVHQEFVLIRDKASGWQTYQAKGFFGRFSGNAKWVWSQQDITLACRRLKKLRENLDSVVSLAGRCVVNSLSRT